MYKHVLMPVAIDEDPDLSRTHEVALKLLDEGGKLTLFHAVEPMPSYVDTYIPPDFQMRSRTKAKAKLDEIAGEIGIENAVVVFESAGRAIVNWAEQNGVDCIVMASHRPAFSDIVLGSTAAWVVRHAGISIHVLR